VMVDSDGRLGTVSSDGPDRGGFSPKGIRPQAIPDAAKQATLDRTIESLQATITQQQQQIETLSAQLKEQTAQIQKVNAQLEMPSLPARWPLVATADFDRDGNPDYLLYNASCAQTAIGYPNDDVVVNAVLGPILPAGWTLAGQ
jgi:hypothetical protein